MTIVKNLKMFKKTPIRMTKKGLYELYDKMKNEGRISPNGAAVQRMSRIGTMIGIKHGKG